MFDFGYSRYCDWESLPDWAKSIAEKLPHESGIDYGWTFYVQKNRKVVFSNGYHYMDEWGIYRGTADFSVTSSEREPLDEFVLHFHSASQYWLEKLDLREYLEEVIAYCVTR